MSGKSTYLRQNALILIMAQSGGFCPANKVSLGVCDKLFCRVGSGDELAKGNSTFMVEMIETANILLKATEKSLVILDEIGRGTSTFDGMSLAWATSEYLIEKINCKTLFATHYNQLAEMEKKFKNLELNTFKVKKWNGELIFMHELTKGVDVSSHGIQVAKMAGIPDKVIDVAKEILKKLENKEQDINNTLSIQSIVTQENNSYYELENLKKKIQDTDLDNITPLESLNLLQEIKKKLNDNTSKRK